MKIAIVHDWIAGIAGDVRVLHALQQLYPNADTFCLSDGKPSRFRMPFMPIRVESLDLSSYDLVISTGSIFSKGLVLRPRTYHINYCHSPTRQVWDLSHARIESALPGKSALSAFIQHGLRIWDRQASTRVDQFVANSRHVQERIRKYYHRESVVVYPPVNQISNLKNQNDNVKFKNYFLIISRLYKHKNIDIAVKAFNKLGWELVIIGDGPELARLKALAGPNVHLLGSLSDALCTMHYSLCTAFILPQEEDFGIAPVEAMMHGKPVLALRRGGALEYIQEGINGLFFDDAHEAVLADGVRRMTEWQFDSNRIRQSVEKFSEANFKNTFRQFLMSNF